MLCFQVMCFIAHIWITVLNQFSCPRISVNIALISYIAWFIWESVVHRGKLRKYAQNSNFEIFESALNLTSVSMPERLFIHHYLICIWHLMVKFEPNVMVRTTGFQAFWHLTMHWRHRRFCDWSNCSTQNC